MELKKVPSQLYHQLWDVDIKQLPAVHRGAVKIGRMVYAITLKFADGELNMRAMSLVYTTLLSIVPLLAVSFSVLRAFGVHNQLEPVLLEFMEPLGERKFEIVTRMVEFVENLRLGVLSSLGMVMLLYTIIAMTHKVEQSFNTIWHVSKARSMARRFSDYLSVILVGPVLVFSGVSLARNALDSSAIKWLASVEPLGSLIYGIGSLVPYVLVCAAFAFLYGFVPNTRVRLTTAVIAGIFAGVLWSIASMIFANLVVNSSNYSAIYAGFASIVLFMVWVYMAWLITLVGGQVGFYWQNPRFLDPRNEHDKLSSREREEIAIEIMTLIAQAHYQHQPLLTFHDLEQRRPDIQPDRLVDILQLLLKHNLIIASADTEPSFLPTRDAGSITLKEILQIIRGQDNVNLQSLPKVDEFMDEIDAAIEKTVADKTIRDLML